MTLLVLVGVPLVGLPLLVVSFVQFRADTR